MRGLRFSLFFALYASISSPSSKCDPPKMIAEIKKSPSLADSIVGHDKSTNKIAGCTWEDTMKAIQEGRQELYDLPFHTDAGFSEDLGISLQLSGLVNPQGLLTRTEECVPSVIEPTLPDWIQLLEKMQQSIQSVSNKELSEKRSKCLASLNKNLIKSRLEHRSKCVAKSQKPDWSGECEKTKRFFPN